MFTLDLGSPSIGDSQSTRAFSRTGSLSQLKTLEALATGKYHAFGIQGYKMVKAGLPPREPKYSDPKDAL